MKKCSKCEMCFGDNVTKCRFCGATVKPITEKKAEAKIVQEYAECVQCGFKQPKGTDKCRFCGGICKAVNPIDVVKDNKKSSAAGNTDKTLQPNKRDLLKKQATEMGLIFAGNISTVKLEEMIVEALKSKQVSENTQSDDTQSDADQPDVTQSDETAGGASDDNIGHSETDSASGEGSDSNNNNE